MRQGQGSKPLEHQREQALRRHGYTHAADAWRSRGITGQALHVPGRMKAHEEDPRRRDRRQDREAGQMGPEKHVTGVWLKDARPMLVRKSQTYARPLAPSTYNSSGVHESRA